MFLSFGLFCRVYRTCLSCEGSLVVSFGHIIRALGSKNPIGAARAFFKN